MLRAIIDTKRVPVKHDKASILKKTSILPQLVKVFIAFAPQFICTPFPTYKQNII